MSLTIHSKYKYFDSTVQRAEDRRQKFHFCFLSFAVNVMLNLSMSVLVHFESWYISLPSSAKQQREMTKFCVLENANRNGYFFISSFATERLNAGGACLA